MKRLITFTLCIVMLIAPMAGCTGSGNPPSSAQPSMTPEERTELYQSAIKNARDDESNQVYPMITSPEDDMADLIFSMIGVTSEDMSAYAISISPMNIRAYGVAAILPAAGKEDTVKKGLQSFIDLQQSNFQQYLVDQYDIAKAAKLETSDDGTLLLVMCENQDAVLSSIKTALAPQS